MDRAYVHFRHAMHFAELFPAARDNAFFQLGGSFFRKRECNNVVRARAVFDEVRHSFVRLPLFCQNRRRRSAGGLNPAVLKAIIDEWLVPCLVEEFLREREFT